MYSTTTTRTDELAFLAQLEVEPDDTATALVYADWLDENGRELEAEHIRVACESEQSQREMDAQKPGHRDAPVIRALAGLLNYATARLDAIRRVLALGGRRTRRPRRRRVHLFPVERLTPHLDLVANGRVCRVRTVPCAVEELGQYHQPGHILRLIARDFTSSPWASAVAAHFADDPAFVGFRLEGVAVDDKLSGLFCWTHEDGPNHITGRLPRYIYSKMEDYEVVMGEILGYPTARDAHTALSCAALAVVLGGKQ